MLGLLPASLLLLAPAARAYFILGHNTLVTTRLDPIISPGQVSQHEHNIVGGSQFSQNYDYDRALTSQCTTAPVNIDFSNYWVPQLYYYDPSNETFQAIPSVTNTYYLQRPGDKNETIHAPPAGLQMVAGDPYRRTFNASNFEDQAVSFVCLDYNNDHTGDPNWEQRNDFFPQNCPDGMRAQVFFPQCWDGVNLKSADQSHMAYPVDTYQGGNCPSSHPVHIIGIFYEFIYQVGDFPFNPPGEVTWVLANGDTTGLGYHGDFTMGWPTGEGNILQQAIDTCGLETGGDVYACKVFAPYLQSNPGCKPENPVVDEPNGLGYTIKALPGNNPIWSGNSTTKPSDPNFNTTSPGFTVVKSVLPTGYSRMGCIAEASSGRVFTAASTTSDDMTLAVCAAFCATFELPYAGVEYGRECYCDFAARNGASLDPVDAKKCSTTCSGLDTENCGGPSFLSLATNPSYFVNATTTASELPTGWSAGPCISDSTSDRSLQGGYYADTKAMTTTSCMTFCQGESYSYAGLTYAQECFCANSLSGSPSVEDEDECSMTCTGNIKETCGGSNRLSLFYYTNTTATSTSTSTSTTASAASMNPVFAILDGLLAKVLVL